MELEEFLELISGIEPPDTVVNPYSGHQEGIDSIEGASEIRLSQLRHYLNFRLDTARVLLIAEAPGYQGARFSGIAMTCERTLLGHRDNVAAPDVLGNDIQPLRTSHVAACSNAMQRGFGFCEPTAAIVWREIMQRGLSRQIVLWNAFPFHPHRPGQLLSNRKPSGQEIADHSHILDRVRELFPEVHTVLAVGNTARDLLAQQGLQVAHVRHPANGATPEFREQINQIFDEHL